MIEANLDKCEAIIIMEALVTNKVEWNVNDLEQIPFQTCSTHSTNLQVAEEGSTHQMTLKCNQTFTSLKTYISVPPIIS